MLLWLSCLKVIYNYMADVKLISDASYDKDLHLTGYAGAVYVYAGSEVDVTYRYSGVAAEHDNIQQGEMLAILVGIRELYRRWDMMEFQLNSLSVYCDNQTCLDMLSGELAITDDTEMASMAQTIHEKLAAMNIQPLWIPIESHKPDIQASGMEKRHNQIDRIAGQARREAIEQMLNPDLSESEHIALLMPGKIANPEVESAIEAIGTYMARNKIKTRVFIDSAITSQHHPFVRAVEAVCREQNLALPYLCKVYYYNAQASRYSMDMTLLRYHVHKEGHDPHFSLSHSPAQSRAAIASRLLFGDPTLSQPYTDVRSGRKYPPSKAVFDLMTPLPRNSLLPNSIQGWIHTYLRYIKLPLIEGVVAALRYCGLPVTEELMAQHGNVERESAHVSLNQSTSANQRNFNEGTLLDDLRRAYMRYDLAGDNATLVAKMINVMQDNGAPSSSLFEQSMTRFMHCNIKAESSVFLRRAISQMYKLCPELKRRH